jgi:hypothetical protein
MEQSVTPISTKSIHVHASCLAAIIGEHQYQDLIEGWMRLWKTIDNQKHFDQTVISCPKDVPQVDAVDALITHYGVNAEVQKHVAEVESKAMQCQDAADVQREIRHTQEAIFATLIQSEHTTSKIKKELSCLEKIIQDKRREEAAQQCTQIMTGLPKLHESPLDKAIAQEKVRQFGAIADNDALRKEWLALATGTQKLTPTNVITLEQKLYSEIERNALKRAEQDIKRIEVETQKLAIEAKPTSKKAQTSERTLKRLLEDSSVPSSYATQAVHAAKKARTEAQDAAETISTGPKQTISCTFGNHQEASSLQHLEQLWNTTIKKDNKYRTLALPGIGKDFTWVLGGRVDGVTADGTLVEIKNRRSRIFDDIPFYEKVQLECYMRIFNAPKIYLVQHLRRKKAGLKQKISLVKRDDFMWDQNIVAQLSRAAPSFEKMLQTPKRCRALLRASQQDPRKRDDLFIREWWGTDTILTPVMAKK